MNTIFEVEVCETLYKVVKVSAESPEEAIEKVTEDYELGNIVLDDYNGFDRVTFNII